MTPSPSASEGRPRWAARLAGAAAGIVLALAGCSRPRPPAPLSAAAPIPITIQADWYPQPEYGGFYQAIARGFYRQAGLDVRVRPGSSGTVPQQIVATDRAQFGIGNSNDVVLAASHGVPLVIVSAYMERDPQGLMVHASSPVHAFRDLNGRQILAVPGSPFIRVLEKSYGMEVGITPTDFGISRFAADPNAIQQCFITNEPYYLSHHDIPVRVLLVADSGFRPYRVIYTRRRLLAQRPDVVRAFVAASLRGWRDYLHGDPQPADRMIEAQNPRMDPPFMAYARKVMIDDRLVDGDPAAGEAPGRIDPARLAKVIGQLKSAGLLSRPVTVPQVYAAIGAAAPQGRR